MISISHPVLFHLYRQMERNRPAHSNVEPTAGIKGRTASNSEFNPQRGSDAEETDFHSFFLKELEKQP
ncbi:MAG: hypothetical protein H7839_07630 [Magnetococcus sp. YQC-5]